MALATAAKALELLDAGAVGAARNVLAALFEPAEAQIVAGGLDGATPDS